MATLFQNLRHRWFEQNRSQSQLQVKKAVPAEAVTRPGFPPIDIAPNDPLVAYFLGNPSAVELDRLQLDSAALKALKAAGVKLVVPLVSQGELVGLLNLGLRLSQQEYSAYDRNLLNNLADHAAPAIRLAQLVREQRHQARQRERLEQELKVARLIQQTLLPKELPKLPGWQLETYYQPAREVGGDFYDFLQLEDGRLGLVIGDVTDKGMPAALVMATTRSILRSVAQQNSFPGKVLEQVNDLLYPDIPARMFVTCLYAILDPASGRLHYANAGHDLPYLRHERGVTELRATGMPLGLMPGMQYEEKEIDLTPGDELLFYSDGLVEAHEPEKGEMFSFPRLMSNVGEHNGPKPLIEYLLDKLADFTGAEWEQEDDITMVALQRSEFINSGSATANHAAELAIPSGQEPSELLAEWDLPSVPGNERQAIEQVVAAVQPLKLPLKSLERLKTAVGEATMNAMEHGNHYHPALPVNLRVLASQTRLVVQITDQGEGNNQPIPQAQRPDLEAKLEELQTPRGWGLFLIKNLVDEMRLSSETSHHTVELIMYLEGEKHYAS